MDNICFDSKEEAKRYGELKKLEAEGKIRHLELQPEFEIQPGYRKDGKAVRAIKYRADFRYYDPETTLFIIEDVKGFKTDVYRIKKKIVEYKYPGVTIKEI